MELALNLQVTEGCSSAVAYTQLSLFPAAESKISIHPLSSKVNIQSVQHKIKNYRAYR